MSCSLVRWIFVFCSLLWFGHTAVLAGRLDDHCDWPPVFERQFGNPDFAIKKSDRLDSDIIYIRPINKVIIKVPLSTTRCEAVDLAIDYFLKKVWNEFLSPDSLSANEREMNMGELVDMSWPEFYRIGKIQLDGNCTGNPLYDAWWSVRMGESLTLSKQYLMSMDSIVWAEGKGNQFGHLGLAVRRRGGVPDCDYIIDFRANWELERRSGFKDLFSDELALIAIRENYYDWLSTQVRYRHCDVTSTFVVVHTEQLRLLENYSRKTHHAGEYRFAKGNCATLGIQVLNRLLPLDQRIPRESTIADLPDRKIKLAAKVFGGAVTVVQHPSETLEIGREINHRNLSLPAEPSRASCSVFRRLAGIRVVN